MNAFERYRAWNVAMYGYYFDNDDQQVLLYVDDDVLEEIGKRSNIITEDLNGKTYSEHFVSATCIKKLDRSSFPKTSQDRNNYPLLYKLMERMSRVSNKDADICMCLPFAVMLLYFFQKGDIDGKRTEQAVKSHIMSYLGEKESFNFSVVEKLWAAIEKNGGENFASSQLAEKAKQPYVGRLKFHLVLKKKDKDAFITVLKNNHLDWDEQQETFSDFINFRVWPHLNSSLIDAIKNPIHDLAKRPYFESLVRSCQIYEDRNNYASTTKRANRLIYVYSWQECNGGIDEKLWFKIDEPEGRYLAPFREEFCFIDEDNTDSIQESVSFKKYQIIIKHDGTELKYENEDSSYILFREIRQGFFEQVHAPKIGENYLFICNQKARNLISKQEFDDLSDFIHAFGTSQIALYIRNWAYDSTWEKQNQSNNYGHLKQQYPRWVGGLLSPNNLKKRSYTYSALPFIEFETEEQAQTAHIDWRVANSDESSWKSVNLSQTISNRRYINKDISFDDPSCTFLHIELRVVKDKSITPLSDMFVSRKQSIQYSDKYGYDKYGICTCPYSHLQKSNIKNSIHHQQSYSDKPTNDFVLLDILTQYSDENGVLSQEKLKNALRYILKYYDIKDEKESRNELIHALVNLGYINGYQDPQDGSYYNQINSPFLSRTQKSFSIAGANVYILRGCYDSDLVRKLTDYSHSSGIKIGYISLSHDKPFCCLPDIIVVDISCLKNYNEISEICGIPVTHIPQAYSIIENIADFKESCTRFLGKNAICQPSMLEKALCPLITHEGNSVFLNYVSDGGSVVKADMYRISEYSRKNIPMGFMYSYVQNMRGVPAVILEPNSLKPDHLELSSFLAIGFTSIMGTNEYLIRALCELSLGLPKVEKAFIVNASQIKISDISSSPLYSIYRSYALSANNEVASKLVEKLVNKPIKDWSSHSNVLITNQRISQSYRVFLSTNKDISDDIFNETRLYLQFRGSLEAFCIRKLNKNHKYEYITCVNFNGIWKRFISGTVNEIFSDVILETKNLVRKYETIQYLGEVPTYMEKKKDGETIPYYDNVAVERLKIITNY